MAIPPQDWTMCGECRADVVLARSPRKSKGQAVDILVGVEEVSTESLSVDVARQWTLTKVGAKYVAGQAATRSKRQAMIDNGVSFYPEHTRTICKNRRESSRR